MDDELREMARRFRMARARAGMTQAEACQAADVSQAALSLYENGRRDPLATCLKRLALVYGVSTDWLMGLSDELSREAP